MQRYLFVSSFSLCVCCPHELKSSIFQLDCCFVLRVFCPQKLTIYQLVSNFFMLYVFRKYRQTSFSSLSIILLFGIYTCKMKTFWAFSVLGLSDIWHFWNWAFLTVSTFLFRVGTGSRDIAIFSK